MKSRLCVSFVVLLGVIIAVSVGIYFKSFKPFSDLEASDISKIYDISYGYPEYALNENQIKTLAELLNKVVLRKTIVSKDGYDGGDLGFRIEYNDGTSIVVSNVNPHFNIDGKIYKIVNNSAKGIEDFEIELVKNMFEIDE